MVCVLAKETSRKKSLKQNAFGVCIKSTHISKYLMSIYYVWDIV